MSGLFPLLLAGHLVGDWVVQTDWMAANKARTDGLWAMLAHVLTYHLAMAAFVLPVWHTRGTALALLVSALTHGFIDRRWPVRSLLRMTGSPEFAGQLWGVIATDQALHLSILCVIAAVAAR